MGFFPFFLLFVFPCAFDKVFKTKSRKRFGVLLGRGQSSVELIVILAASLTMLLLIVALSSSQIVDIGGIKAETDARNTVNDLVRAADFVYQQGPGARKKITIKIPEGVEADNTLVQNKSINIRVNGNDFTGESKADLTGSIPVFPGNYECWVRSYGSYVSVCTAFLEVAPTSIYGIIEQGGSGSEDMVVSNIGNESIDVTITVYWNYTDTKVVASHTDFTLAPKSQKDLIISFDSTSVTGGIFTGSMVVEATGGNITDVIEVPITIEVLSPPPGSGECVPVNVDVETFEDSGYIIPTSNFNTSEAVIVSTGNWSAGELLTIDITGPSGSVSGYPKDVYANSSGEYTVNWNSAGATQGDYSAIVNNSEIEVVAGFSITGC